MKVAIVDTGIDLSKFDKCNFTIKEYCSKRWRIKEVMNDFFINSYEHGTVVFYSIVNEIEDSNTVNFVSYQLLDENLRGNIYKLLLYLLHATYIEKVDIIHLSLGTKEKKWIPGLYLVTRVISICGVLLVSSASNNNCKSYPSSFKHVIGIVSKANLFNNPHLISESGIINYNGKQYVGSSIAAGQYTGKMINQIVRGEWILGK